MDRNSILSEINKIFIEELDNENIIIEEKTKAADIEEWDSLSHIILIVAIEKKFNIRFTAEEIQSWKDVGEMLKSIQAKGI